MRLALLLALACACRVDRKSSHYECATSADCTAGRACEDGYCTGTDPEIDAAPTECPAACTSCDLRSGTCFITGEHGADIHCPAGFACTIRCLAEQACGDITCDAERDCTITCTGKRACGDIQCGTGACRATCSGERACGDLDCRASCACDAACTGGTGPIKPCDDFACPLQNGDTCSLDGTEDTACSSFPPNCNSC